MNWNEGRRLMEALNKSLNDLGIQRQRLGHAPDDSWDQDYERLVSNYQGSRLPFIQIYNKGSWGSLDPFNLTSAEPEAGYIAGYAPSVTDLQTRMTKSAGSFAGERISFGSETSPIQLFVWGSLGLAALMVGYKVFDGKSLRRSSRQKRI